MPSKPKVYFFYQNVKFTLSNRSVLKKFIESVFKREGKKLGSVNYIFVSDEALLEINKQYLKHDLYTDIITFDLSESDDIIADIYISIDRIRDNANIHGSSFKSELHRVIFHGALHLCGFKDKTKAEKAEIRAKEDFYLAFYLKWA